MKARKKSFVIMAALFLVIAILSGCATSNERNAAGNQGSKDPGQKLPVRYLLPGNAPEDLAAAVAGINKKLEADGLQLTYEPIYIPWDVWDQKTNLMMSTGEEFEIIAIMHDLKSPNVLVGNGGIIPIDDLLEKHGPELKKMLPDWIWESAVINDKIYYVPNFWIDTAFSNGMVTMRSDLLEKNGLQPPATPDDLLTAAETIKKNWPEDDKNVFIKMLDEPAHYLHNTYESFPFTVVDNMIYVDQEGNVKSWIESEEFKNDVEYMRTAYERKLIHPDVLTVPTEVMSQEEKAGRYLYRPGDVSIDDQVRERFPGAEADIYYLGDKTQFRSYAIRNSNGISATSPHPEAGVQFLNWVYSSQENFDLVTNGIEGEHWKDTGKNLKETLKFNKNGGSAYELAVWLLGHVEMNRYPTNYDINFLTRRTTIADDAVNSITIGFNFDPTPVAAEYANVVAEMKTSVDPLTFGVVSYDKAHAEIVSNMKAAGLDKVVAEYEKQFKAWLASK
ncbi:extracellular solute-binding protein [Paenibacillus alkaliterrae]|uniref:extracellular solute-binding protein n=1 Tax=Paenibacillus alkaliterrae TaxID=320909 RepID=UPI001F19EEF1|nr:extracellular solute-binding protein [Paenibacillus alkaliterrae]MCF2940471.1 extracellular solute-binding protein [Paenibacillus alkaliterrae]